MNVKAVVLGVAINGSYPSFNVSFFDSDNGDSNFDNPYVSLSFGTDLYHGINTKQIYDNVAAKLITYASNNGYTLSVDDIYWPGLSPSDVGMFQTRSYNNAPSRSIVTGTGATGFQISATREANVQYSPTMVTTASISGNASDIIVFEICATNSATAGDWKEIGRLTNAQTLTLAITLQSVQTTSGQLGGLIPAGWYAKMRAITSGTVSNSFSSGQEVLI